MVVLHHSKAPIDAGSRGYELLLENGRVAFGLHHMWPGNSLKVVTKRCADRTVDACRGELRRFEPGRRACISIWMAKPAELEVVRDGLSKDITYESGGEPDLALGYRFRDNGFKGGKVDEFQFSTGADGLEAAHLAGRATLRDAWNRRAERSPRRSGNSLLDYYFATMSHRRRCANCDELHAPAQRAKRLVNPIPEVMVMQELPTPKPAYILRRGAYDAHGEQVYAEHAGRPAGDACAISRAIGWAWRDGWSSQKIR